MKMVVDDIPSTARPRRASQPLMRLKDDVSLYSTEADPLFDDSVWYADNEILEAHRLAVRVWADLEWDPTITF